MSTGKKVALIIVAVIFALILAGGIGAYAYVHNMLNKVEKVDIDETNLGATENDTTANIQNIALFGIDAEEGETGRSDSIMILTLDKTHNRMKLTSIMRDSYVNIPDHGMDKINHAYAFGGPELAIRTLNENFGLNITDFASVNFTSMPEIIDELGGVTIDITAEEVATGSIPGITTPGEQLLNGEQALAYSRIRYATGDDFKRTERQRTVMNELVTKLAQQPSSSYPTLFAELAPYIQTSLSNNEIISLATEYGSLAKQGIRMARFPLDDDCSGQMIDGTYYLVFDIPTEREKLDAYIFEDAELAAL